MRANLCTWETLILKGKSNGVKKFHIFLNDHIKNLSKFYEVDTLANFGPNHQEQENKLHVPIYRKINLLKDYIPNPND